MKRIALAALAAMLVSSSTGCCLIDRMFHCNTGCGGCSTMCQGCAGGCSSCGSGGGSCDSCGQMGGHPAVTYGQGSCCGGVGARFVGDGTISGLGGCCNTMCQGCAGGDCGGCDSCGGGCGDGGCSGGGCGDGDCAGGGCGAGGCGLCRKERKCYQQEGDANQNYPGAYVGYPYYTLRGPRDFLACNPGGLSR